MRFLQFYYALPIAMVILSVTLVPFFHRANVFTAYQYLETRFDAKTRTFTALLFLFSRSLSCSVVISAPAVVMSVILGLNVTITCLLIGIPTTIYTMFGGVQAVAWTDVKQMFAVVASLLIAVTVLIARAAARRQRRRRAARRRHDRPPADVRLPARPHRAVHVLVGHDRGAVPVPVVLRHRPEPGAALSRRRSRWTRRARRC